MRIIAKIGKETYTVVGAYPPQKQIILKSKDYPRPCVADIRNVDKIEIWYDRKQA